MSEDVVDREGVFIPDYCPRKRIDCKSLSQIISEGHRSFVCCGENNGETRAVQSDRFRVCFKNSTFDDMQDWNEQDIYDMQSILSQAISHDHHLKQNLEDNK